MQRLSRLVGVDRALAFSFLDFGGKKSRLRLGLFFVIFRVFLKGVLKRPGFSRWFFVVKPVVTSWSVVVFWVVGFSGSKKCHFF